jgi:hypothetical protein
VSCERTLTVRSVSFDVVNNEQSKLQHRGDGSAKYKRRCRVSASVPYVHDDFGTVSVILAKYVAMRSIEIHGLLIHGVSRVHATTHHKQDSSGRVISSSKRLLLYSTQHSRRTSIPPAGFEPTMSADERPMNYD